MDRKGFPNNTIKLSILRGLPGLLIPVVFVLQFVLFDSSDRCYILAQQPQRYESPVPPGETHGTILEYGTRPIFTQPVETDSPLLIAQRSRRNTMRANTVRMQPSDFGLMRISITWGGGEAKPWYGTIYLENGILSDPVSLGADTDLSGTITQEGNNIVVRQRHPNTFNGFHVTVHANRNETLKIAFFDGIEEIRHEIPLKDIFLGTKRIQLDKQNNQLEIERTVGDEIAVHVHRDSLIFEPGETLELDAAVRLLAVKETKNLMLNVALCRARSDENLSNPPLEATINPENGQTVVPMTVPMPREEGAYDILLTLYHKGEQSLFPLRYSKDRIVAQRRVQCLVLSRTPKKREYSNGNADFRGLLLGTIDTTQPQWWKPLNESEKKEKESFIKNPLAPLNPLKSNLLQGFTDKTKKKVKSKSDEYRWYDVRTWGKPNKQEDYSVFGLYKGTEGQEPARPFWQKNLGSGHHSTFEPIPNLGLFSKLEPSGDLHEPSWESYSFPVERPGRPHILEIDFPANLPQSMGISIIEPSPSGTIWPTSVNSGIRITKEIVRDRSISRVLTHRMLIWPKTKSPLIVLTNQSDETPIVYGKIRLYSCNETTKAFSDASNRLFAGYMHRPNFVEQFSGTLMESPYQLSGVTDWQSFYEGGSRLSDYLLWTGYDGLMVSVAADGDTLYPGQFLGKTSRYDTGAFLASGPDPVSKDILDMLFRMFNREHLKLIPAIDFNAPLPILEAKIRQMETENRGSSLNSGLLWIGPDGVPITQKRDSHSGKSPYYNMLNPEVQNAMLQVISELAERSARSGPAFAGIAVQLSPDGYAQLPDDCWGMDDTTIAMFQRDMKLEFPENISAIPKSVRPQNMERGFDGMQPGMTLGLDNVFSGNDFNGFPEKAYDPNFNRYAAREAYIRTNCRDQWLYWRARQVALFYDNVRQIITQSRTDAKLYLAGAQMFEGEHSREMLRPTLPKRNGIAQAMMRIGFDLSYYGRNDSVVFLRPHRLENDNSPISLSIVKELESDEAEIAFTKHTLQQGSLFHHVDAEIELDGLNEASPFQPCNSHLNPVSVPADLQNRSRFIKDITTADTKFIFDGGTGFHFGQEDSIRDLIATFRRLPIAPFKTFVPPARQTPSSDFDISTREKIGPIATVSNNVQETSTQPVTLRVANLPNGTWFYLCNDSPYYVGTRITFSARPGCVFTEQSNLRRIDPPSESPQGVRWTVTLQPYDLIAVRITDPEAYPVDMEVSRPKDICGKDGHLARKVVEFGERIKLISREGVIYPVLQNPDFEAVPNLNAAIPGWQMFGENTCSISLDGTTCPPQSPGKTSLKISSNGGSGGVLSNPFDASNTGRLFIWGELGIPENLTNLPLRLSLVGYHEGKPFSRVAFIGDTILPRAKNIKPVNGIHWHPVLVPFNDLPFEGLEQLSVRFDMTGPGTVWIDDLRIYELAFTDAERTELARMLSVANYRLSNERYSDTLSMLEDFWPQMLSKHLKLPSEGGTFTKSQNDPPPIIQPVKPENTSSLKKPEEKKEKPSVFNKIRDWFK